MDLVDLWNRSTDVPLLGTPLDRWLVAAAAGLAAYLVLTLALRVFIGRAQKLATRSKTQIDDVIVDVLRGTRRWVLVVVAFLLFLELLALPLRWQSRVSQLWFVVIMVQLALWVSRALKLLMQRQLERHTNMPQASASATLLSWALQTALWVTVVLAVLANLGVNITALVTSLGVGGIAVALAVQNILGDLFASLAIALDKPFEVGDAISVNNVSGTVERVGLKTTRIRALGGEQIVMSNADLLKSAVSNFKRQSQRRIVLKFAVSMNTPAARAAAIPDLVREIVEGQEEVRFDRAHLLRLADGAFEYEAVYIVLSADYKQHMDVQQRIYLALIERLQAEDVEFAGPKTVTAVTVAPDGKPVTRPAG